MRHRITFDVTPEQHRFFQELPHGMINQIFQALVFMLLDMVNRGGYKALGLILGKRFELERYFNDGND